MALKKKGSSESVRSKPRKRQTSPEPRLRVAERRRLEEEEEARKAAEAEQAKKKRRQALRTKEHTHLLKKMKEKREKNAEQKDISRALDETRQQMVKEEHAARGGIERDAQIAFDFVASSIFCAVEEHVARINGTCPASCWGPIDSYALCSPVLTCPEKLASRLSKHCGSPITIARACFKWIAHNITYDSTANLVGDPMVALRTRTSAASGFAKLLDRLFCLSGLESEVVLGYAKGVGYQDGAPPPTTPNHTWNAIKIDGKWCFFDVSWAQGYGSIQGLQVVTTADYDDMWFNTPPEVFVLSHYSATGPVVPAVQNVCLATFFKLPSSQKLRRFMMSLQGSGRTLFFNSLLISAQSGLSVQSPDYYCSHEVCSVMAVPFTVAEGENRFKFQFHKQVQRVSVGSVPGEHYLTHTGNGVWEGSYHAPSPLASEFGVFWSPDRALWHTLLAY
eukprot:TRINITY_DN28332_c0_g1_i1.p1 TRINITY_DN28332_c0_g1~~TRINITY_DN28332_c0_g1_i1.p1  ORF type:complete len:449 (+),score=70.15 TRINITY_DN28332_c0_g1_i1:56-1402(+)